MTIPWDQDTYDRSTAQEEAIYEAWADGRQDEAIALGEAWWADVPDMEGMPLRQGSIFIARAAAEAGRPDEGKKWMLRATEAYGGDEADDQDRETLGFAQGIVDFHAGNLDRAETQFQASYDFLGRRAFDLPKDQVYWDFFAQRTGLAETGQPDQQGPSDASLEKLAAEGDQLHEGGDAEGAVAVWEQAIAQLGPNPAEHPMSMWFFAAIADAQFELGHHAQANDAAAQALIAGGTDNGFVWLRKGQALIELGDQKAGIEALTSAYMLKGDEIFEDEDPRYRQLLVDGGIIR